MSLRVRLALLMVLLTALPALPAALVARQLIQRSLSLGLSPQVDGALQAGVRQAQRELQSARRDVQQEARAWAAGWSSPAPALSDNVLRLRRARGMAESSRDHVVLRDPRGAEQVVMPGVAGTQPATPAPEGEPPHSISIVQALTHGWSLEVSRSVDPIWREDAAALASTHQLVRGLEAQQSALERSFWLPFLVIYGVALVVGTLAALRLGRGITVPVQRLLGATDAVAAGRWDVQVAPAGADEVGRLTRRFNTMVRRLDAQSRRLIDLETMAGWREMARALAHEVKNPLTPIQLTVEEMRERYSGDDPAYRKLLDECARIVVEEVQSLRNVVSRFREFSTPVELRPAPVALNRLVEDVAALQRDLGIELELDPAVDVVHLDEDRIRQVLMNLAENARAATRGVASPRLLLGTAAAGDQVTILIEDNGPGIPPSERERVFEPYRSSTAGGLGLGLALVKGIVLAHAGTIQVVEGRWGGARFQIALPRTQSGGHM